MVLQGNYFGNLKVSSIFCVTLTRESHTEDGQNVEISKIYYSGKTPILYLINSQGVALQAHQ